MEERESMEHLSGLSSGIRISGEEVGNPRKMKMLNDLYLHAKSCIEEVQNISSLEFNNEQCQYLIVKLQGVIQSASLFLEAKQGDHHESYSSLDIERWTEIFKLLLALATQVQSFIQDCCRQEWMQAAMTLSHVSEYVSSLGFNLELCKVALGNQRSATGCGLTLVEVDNINKAEVKAVKDKASVDMDSLRKPVTRIATSSPLDPAEDKNKELARCLLRRLMGVEPNSTSEEGGYLSKLFDWVNPSCEPKLLGRGISAAVYGVDWQGIPAAKKTFFGSRNLDFMQEVGILSQLCHPNITSMFCCTKSWRSCSIIMELMDGSLHELLQNKLEKNAKCPPFPILEAVDVMLQIGEGVNYLHNKHVIHRDLKSMNILVKRVSMDSKLEIGYVIAKVVDFGLSKTKENSTTRSNMTWNTGTSSWMAPEVINLVTGGKASCVTGSVDTPKHKFKIDIYSFAMVCYEILTGRVPFESERLPRIVKEMVLDGKRPELPDHCPLMLKNLIRKCWHQDPVQRPTFDHVCQKLKYFKYLLMTGMEDITDNNVEIEVITRAVVSTLLTEVINDAKRANRCKESCNNLLSTLKSVKPLLDDPELSINGSIAYEAWLSDLHCLLVKTKSIMEKCVISKTSNRFTLLQRGRLSSIIVTIDHEIRKKIHEANLPTVDIFQQTATIAMQPVPAAFKMDPFKNLKNLIISAADAPSGEPIIIGLIGQGGVGKTWLATMVQNDEDILVKYGAGSILWITVGGLDASVPSIYLVMGKFLNNSGVFEREYAQRNLEDQRSYLFEAFKRRRILLILDDVWEIYHRGHGLLYWLDICNGPGSATLVTTRHRSLLNNTNTKAKEKIEVLPLSQEESWKLFCYHAFQTQPPPEAEVEDRARKICDECKGLPLALKVIGGALLERNMNMDKESGWVSALDDFMRATQTSNPKTLENELFHRLKFSYDALDEDSKKCFLYFAAFPADYRISTAMLCSIWEAEKLFQGSCDDEDMFDMGRMKLISLADRCLIRLDEDEDGGYATMHDILRDLAAHIISEAKDGEWAFECQFEPGKMMRALPTIRETTRRVSFVGTCVESFGPSNHVQFLHLQVCLLTDFSIRSGGTQIPLVFPKEFFTRMSGLLYLDLTRTTVLIVQDDCSDDRSIASQYGLDFRLMTSFDPSSH